MEVSNKNYVCREIPAKVARDIVKKYHYSHKVVPNSNLHLGIFDKQSNELVGALQFGPPMNLSPHRTTSLKAVILLRC